MSLTQTILSSLQKNIVNGAGGTILAQMEFLGNLASDKRTGYIDVKNPNNADVKTLKTQALKYLKSLPKGKWEFNPDTPQKGRIYGQRILKVLKGSTPNIYQ